MAGVAKTMNTLDVRVESFSKPPPKRRSSVSSKPASAPALKWPSDAPSPERLAVAGFYWKPTSASPDNCTCYLCNKSLDGWEPEDEPYMEHLKHSPNCGWAIVHAICLKLKKNHDAKIEDPRSDEMLTARMMTYGNWWPHEKKKGWTPKVEELSKAGFHYQPTNESDDFVLCVYCSLGLDGWEQEDNPLTEHERRSPGCRFFTWNLHTKVVRGSKARAPSATRARRGSVASKIGNESRQPSEEPELELPKTGKRGVKGTRKASAATKRGREKAMADSDMESIADSPEPYKPPEPRIARGGRKRTSSVKREPESIFTAEDLAGAMQGPPKKKRTTKKGRASIASSVADNDENNYDSDASIVSNATTASKKGGRGKGRPRKGITSVLKDQPTMAVPDDEEIDRVLELDLDRSDEELDVTKFTKPFLKTPSHRKLTPSDQIIQHKTLPQAGEPQKFLLNSVSKVPRASATPSPTKARLLFKEKDLDYSLPISIPKHLSTGPTMDERPDSRGRPQEVDQVTTSAPVAIPTKASTMSQDTETDEQPKKKVLKGRKKASAPKKSKKAVEPDLSEQQEDAPTFSQLRNIRKSLDGGMLIFEGGKDSDEDEAEQALVQPVEENVSALEEEEVIVQMKKGRKKVAPKSNKTSKPVAKEPISSLSQPGLIKETVDGPTPPIKEILEPDYEPAPKLKRGRKATKKPTRVNLQAEVNSRGETIPENVELDQCMEIDEPDLPHRLVPKPKFKEKNSKKRPSSISNVSAPPKRGKRNADRAAEGEGSPIADELMENASAEDEALLVQRNISMQELNREHPPDIECRLQQEIRMSLSNRESQGEDHNMGEGKRDIIAGDDDDDGMESDTRLTMVSPRKDAIVQEADGDKAFKDNKEVIQEPPKLEVEEQHRDHAFPAPAPPSPSPKEKRSSRRILARRISEKEQKEVADASATARGSYKDKPTKLSPTRLSKGVSFQSPEEHDNNDDETEEEDNDGEEAQSNAKGEEIAGATGRLSNSIRMSSFSPTKLPNSSTPDLQTQTQTPKTPNRNFRHMSNPSSSLSPFKVAPGNPIQTNHPWTEIDLDAVLARTFLDTDNTAEDDGPQGGDGKITREGDAMMLMEIDSLLTEEEKQMTVQQWIKQNAEDGERKFRGMCEDMIGRVWEQGRRAIKAVEGIRVKD